MTASRFAGFTELPLECLMTFASTAARRNQQQAAATATCDRSPHPVWGGARLLRLSLRRTWFIFLTPFLGADQSLQKRHSLLSRNFCKVCDVGREAYAWGAKCSDVFQRINGVE